MNESPPSRNEWQELFEAAAEFRKLQPWAWMADSDVFGVEDPETGRIGYCSVMGALGEFYALGVYAGAEGLEGYVKIQAGEVPLEEALYVQNCLMASFEPKDQLNPEDLEVIKDLGLKFRGKNAWPLFRSYDPGLMPWMVNGRQARFLATALRQAVDVARRFKEDEKLLLPPEEDAFLVRAARKSGKDKEPVWEDLWLTPVFEKQTEAPVISLDEARFQKMMKKVKKAPGAWEIDFFYIPTIVREGDERPFFPYLCMCADRGSGMILDSTIARHSEHGNEFRQFLMGMFEEQGAFPSEIHISKEEVATVIGPIAARLKIKLKRQKTLKQVEAARRAMFDTLGREPE